jgi:hypothetical protein
VTKGNFPKYVSSNFSAPAQDAMGAGRRAKGGPVTAGMPYVVGDGGRPELFVPKQDGMILPSVPTAMSGGGGMNAQPVAVYGGGLGQLVFEWLRTEIQSRGGTLAVLGLRS